MLAWLFPFYSCRYWIWGLKRLNNLPKITQVVCGVGRAHALVCWAPTSRLSSILPATAQKPQITVISLHLGVDHIRGVQASSYIRPCFVTLGQMVSRSHLLLYLPLSSWPIQSQHPQTTCGQPSTMEAALLSYSRYSLWPDTAMANIISMWHVWLSSAWDMTCHYWECAMSIKHIPDLL